MFNEIICNFDNLYEAYKLAHRGKENKPEVIEFDKNKIANIHRLQKKLEAKDFESIFVYYRFMIREPKERIVDALTFEGRIVQHVICDKILHPYFENRLISTNCACRVGKGTDYAVKMFKGYMAKFVRTHPDGYVLKMDVKKYFPSIDRSVLKAKLAKFPDDEIRDLLYWIIDHSPDDNGLPIGNQTSQWFALYYLDRIDRIIKENYRIKYYVRYMDDLVILCDTKAQAQDLLAELTNVARDELRLTFNSKTQIFPVRNGVAFIGWKFKPTATGKILMLLTREKKKQRIKTIKVARKKFEEGKIKEDKLQESLLSVTAFLQKGNTYGFIERYIWATKEKESNCSARDVRTAANAKSRARNGMTNSRMRCSGITATR